MAEGKRRVSGEGTIYQDSAGQWWAAISLGQRGKRKAVRCPKAQNTRQKARQLLKELQKQREAGVDVKAGRQTVKDFLEQWLNDVAIPNIGPSTALRYQQYIETGILPVLGNHRLDQLTAEDVQLWLNDLRKVMADTTTRSIFNLLRRALKKAVAWGRIMRNVVDYVDPPRMRRIEQVPLTVSEAQALLAAVEGHRNAMFYRMALMTGLRLGELLGLAWCDLDWQRGTIRVTQQVRTIGDKTILCPPKSESSVRTIPLPPNTLARLRQHWEAQQEAGKQQGADWDDHGLLFPSARGTPRIPRNLEREYHLFRAKAGLPETANFHKLRHTCASFMAESGVSEAIIGAILGHAGGSVTRRYTHATLVALQEAITNVETMLLREAA